MDEKFASQHLPVIELLVDLEDEHKHLKATVDHLEREVKKREIKVKSLLAERELAIAKEHPELLTKTITTKQSTEKLPKVLTGLEKSNPNIIYSSEFSKQVSQLVNHMTKTSEEIAASIKL